MKSLNLLAFAAVVGIFQLSNSPQAEAHVLVGVRGGQYLDLGDSKTDDPFLGVELIAGITNRVYFNPNVEYVFVDKAKVGTGNLDFHVDLPIGESAHVWVGAGLAAVYTDPDGAPKSETDLGANLLLGAGVNVGRTIPYAQLKLLLVNDSKDLVWAVGIRF